MNRIFLSIGLLITGFCHAETVFPREGWVPEPSPLAAELAEPGGRLRMFASQYPKSFNYYLDQNLFSSKVFSMMYETLLGADPVTLDTVPGLAEKVVVSDDKKVFTFHLDPRAKWSDGKPVTAQDVVWTWKAILVPTHLTGSHKVSLSKFESAEALDDRTVRFVAKEVHWKNLIALGNFEILPSHWWKSREFNKVNTTFPVVSGPFEIGKLNEPHSILMQLREDYWDQDNPVSEGLGNFDEVEFRFYSERDFAYDNFLKNEFDLFAVYTSHRWVAQTKGEKFDRNWVVKQSVYNKNPIGFQGFAMNMRREKFQDLRVRKALAHLLDRDRLNATIMHNQYFLHQSFFEDLYDEAHPCGNQVLGFDIAAARQLLADAGWAVNDEGKLEKDGQTFVINFLTRNAGSDKFLIIYREALDQVGIELKIDRKDWSAWAKDMDEYNYDMTWAAFGASLYKDPEPMWHSKHKDTPSGLNVTGFADPEVDRMIDSMTAEFDLQKRLDVIRKIDKRLTDAVPYVLLWNINYTRLLYWNKFGTPDHVLGKFTEEWASRHYWWIDLDAEADLEQAMEDEKKLPGRPLKVHFDKVFTDTPAVPPVQ